MVKWKLQKKLKHLPNIYDNYNFDPTICLIFSCFARLQAALHRHLLVVNTESPSAPGPLFGGDVTEAQLQLLRDYALIMNL